MKQLIGFFFFLFGASILLWIGYNLLIEQQPEFKGTNPWLGLGFCASVIGWGVKWMRGE